MDKSHTVIHGAVSGGAQKSDPAAGKPVDVVFFNLSDLIGCPVRYEDEGRAFARLYDIGGSTLTAYPLSSSLELKLRRGRAHVFHPWSAVKSMTTTEVVVRRTAEPAPAADFWARRDVLDDQVVDVSGA